MKNKSKKLISLLLVCLMLLSLAGCSGGSGTDADGEETHLIGVAVFSSTEPEPAMYYSYYRDYISESFPVEFMASEALNSADDEIAFIEEMKAEGAEGIISFYGPDLQSIVAACEENEIYYVLGAASVSDEEYNAVKDNPWFLGVIGVEEEEEFNAGADMARNFAEQGSTSFLIASGGAMEQSNYMHYIRVMGMLTAIAEELDLTYEDPVEELAQATEVTVAATDRDDVNVVISPGYLDTDMGSGNLSQAFASGDYDALMSAAGVSGVFDLISDEIESATSEMLVGVVEAFTKENYDAVEKKDAYGNPLLNYVTGRYASMVAPAFVAVFNAIEGDVDVVKPDGTAFRIFQSFWTASDADEYVELYSYTQSIYENAYSSWDMMEVIGVYNDDADYDAFEELTVSCDIDSVRERMGK